MEAEVVLEMVFRHAPDEDGEAPVDELGQLFLVGFEVPDEIFVVHDDMVMGVGLLGI